MSLLLKSSTVEYFQDSFQNLLSSSRLGNCAPYFIRVVPLIWLRNDCKDKLPDQNLLRKTGKNKDNHFDNSRAFQLSDLWCVLIKTQSAEPIPAVFRQAGAGNLRGPVYCQIWSWWRWLICIECGLGQGLRSLYHYRTYDPNTVSYLLYQVDGGLQVQTKINKFPLNSFSLVFFLLQDEHLKKSGVKCGNANLVLTLHNPNSSLLQKTLQRTTLIVWLKSCCNFSLV